MELSIAGSVLIVCSPRRIQVALVLSGRFAGRKVIVIRQSDEGTKVRIEC